MTTETLLPTTVVGSYAARLADRSRKARAAAAARIRAQEFWRVPEPRSKQAQDDATAWRSATWSAPGSTS